MTHHKLIRSESVTTEEEEEVAQILLHLSQKVLRVDPEPNCSWSKNNNSNRDRSASGFTLVNWGLKRRRVVASPPPPLLKSSDCPPKEQALRDCNDSNVDKARQFNVAKQCNGLEENKVSHQEEELSEELSRLSKLRLALSKAMTDALRFCEQMGAHNDQLKQRQAEVESELLILMKSSLAA